MRLKYILRLACPGSDPACAWGRLAVVAAGTPLLSVPSLHGDALHSGKSKLGGIESALQTEPKATRQPTEGLPQKTHTHQKLLDHTHPFAEIVCFFFEI